MIYYRFFLFHFFAKDTRKRKLHEHKLWPDKEVIYEIDQSVFSKFKGVWLDDDIFCYIPSKRNEISFTTIERCALYDKKKVIYDELYMYV